MRSSNFKLGSSPTTKKSRKQWVALLLVIVLAAAGLFLFQKHRSDQRAAQSAQQQKQKSEAQTDSAKKNDSEDNAKDSSTSSNTSASTTEEVPTNTARNVTISDFSQSGGVVNASASITGTTTSGTCVFTFTNPEDKPVTRQTASSGSSPQACSTSINEVEFSKLGSWTLTVNFYQNGQKSEASQKVTIN
jgi:type II secretory pathway pseudopilin PulG